MSWNIPFDDNLFGHIDDRFEILEDKKINLSYKRQHFESLDVYKLIVLESSNASKDFFIFYWIRRYKRALEILQIFYIYIILLWFE